MGSSCRIASYGLPDAPAWAEMATLVWLHLEQPQSQPVVWTAHDLVHEGHLQNRQAYQPPLSIKQGPESHPCLLCKEANTPAPQVMRPHTSHSALGPYPHPVGIRNPHPQQEFSREAL